MDAWSSRIEIDGAEPFAGDTLPTDAAAAQILAPTIDEVAAGEYRRVVVLLHQDGRRAVRVTVENVQL